MAQRQRATLEQKVMVIDYYKKTRKLQSEIVQRFKDKFAISTSSLSEWIKNEDELKQRYRDAMNSDITRGKALRLSRRKSTFKYAGINEAMENIVKQRQAQGLEITEGYLRECWMALAPKYNIKDAKRLKSFSHGWLDSFKKRHGLRRQVIRTVNEDFIEPDDTNIRDLVGYISTEESTDAEQMDTIVFKCCERFFNEHSTQFIESHALFDTMRRKFRQEMNKL